ncbi:hypothetical protein CKQ70_17000 [Bacillus toyonensis]|nr:hypothetical protein CKQ70_17000 [Bacillus toyonensis]PAW46103.1 hypothetical protein CKQ69_03295 [Bacillus toyonensis]
MYWDIQHVKNNMKFQLIHLVNLSKKGASIKVFHLRIGFMDLNKSVILVGGYEDSFERNIPMIIKSTLNQCFFYQILLSP